MIVVLVMVMHFWSSFLISALLPLAVLMCFIGMKVFGVDANIVALSGIAIAIGTMVDMGIIICENILKHLDEAGEGENRLEIIYQATREVGSAILTAVSTTVVSFLPVFTMVAAEGKLFKPLAYTKTFALIAAVIVALTIIPPCAHILFGGKIKHRNFRHIFYSLIVLAGILIIFFLGWWLAGLLVTGVGLYKLCENRIPQNIQSKMSFVLTCAVVFVVGLMLTSHWLPLGPEKGMFQNFIMIAGNDRRTIIFNPNFYKHV